MKKASLPWQRGFFFLLVLQHLSVAFGDSSPQGEPSHPESLPLRGGGTAQAVTERWPRRTLPR